MEWRVLKKQFRLLFFCLISAFLFTQEIKSQLQTQIIKGSVVDNETQVPLVGAAVIILDNDPPIATKTGNDGYFKFTAVPAGRHKIQVSYIGYEPVIVPELLLTSGKELVININLKQSVINMDEVAIKAYNRKDRPLNPMASISARSFTVEETRRYAGGLDDPARIASAFAGVTESSIRDNAIIIRGNAPKGVSWRLEGVEIPNPNHFSGRMVAGGGGVSIFSSQLLSNSDFYTGAFPAEYGNAMAGVFDMKLRSGNDEKIENTFQAGILGIEFSSEGPFNKKSKATYLFNYRYSTLSILSKMDIIPRQQAPNYQDLSFKVCIPLSCFGILSLWGIGAIDKLAGTGKPDSSKWQTIGDRLNDIWNLHSGASGVSYKLIAGDKTFFNTSLAVSGIQNEIITSIIDSNLLSSPYWNITDRSGKITLSSFANHKFNTKLTIKTGINLHTLFYYLNLNSIQNEEPGTFRNIIDKSGLCNFYEYYIQAKYNITQDLIVNIGVNANYFALNKNYSTDPRFGIKWEFKPKHSLSFGYGVHSQLEELKIYFIEKKTNGFIHYPNKNLKMSKAQHFVLGYDWLINNNLRLKIEPYYQYLYNIPGIPDSSYSLINFKQDWALSDSLVNNSIGRNFGIDFTLEHFLSKNYYFLVTGSVFSSRYNGGDGIWRNTRFDKGYALNLLFGREFIKKGNNILGANIRFTYTGGERISPLLVDQSIKEKRIIYDEAMAFEARLPVSYYLDFTMTYHINRKRYSSIWAMQIKNVLGSPMVEGYSFNYRKNNIQQNKYVVIIPVLSYKIEF